MKLNELLTSIRHKLGIYTRQELKWKPKYYGLQYLVYGFETRYRCCDCKKGKYYTTNKSIKQDKIMKCKLCGSEAI